MPTYEYVCRNCGKDLEVVQAFSDDALTRCPNCGGELRKVFGNVGIVFKGSGFYKTDSRSSSSAAKTAGSENAPKHEHSDGASGPNGSTDSPSSTSTTESPSTPSSSTSAASSTAPATAPA